MPSLQLASATLLALQHALGLPLAAALQTDHPLARYTTMRVGGPAQFFLTVASETALAQAATAAWCLDLPLTILGAGSNVLIHDAGLPGLVVLNRARTMHFTNHPDRITVRAASGLLLPSLARACIQRGAAGLEWAATVPGTVGGALYGNAGAHGSDMATNTHTVTYIHRQHGRQTQPYADLHPAYRRTDFKAAPGQAVILAAEFDLTPSDPATLQATVTQFTDHRKRTQPGGNTSGSMFKNPPGDYAGRLIESVGLKGYSIGGAQVSPRHANFFVNLGSATAQDVYALLTFVRESVLEKTGIFLELEVELWGVR